MASWRRSSLSATNTDRVRGVLGCDRAFVVPDGRVELRQSEVHELRGALGGTENVRRCHVSVRDAAGVRMCQGAGLVVQKLQRGGRAPLFADRQDIAEVAP